MVDILLKKVIKDCPICNKTHEVEERKRTTKGIVKNEAVEYEEIYYQCTECKDEDENLFVPAKTMDENLLRARNAYRRMKGLLTSEEIAEIRRQYGLTQAELSLLLGWGEVTVTRYESKAIQDQTYDSILRLVKENPIAVLENLDRNKDNFEDSKYQIIRNKALENIEVFGREYLKHMELESEYLRFQQTPDYTGNQKLNIEKIENAVCYFAIYTSELYKVKLMKLLWYADALHFKLYGQGMFGLVYEHKQNGALPIGHNKLLELGGIKYQEIYNEDFIYSSYKIMPNDQLKISVFTQQELEVLNRVADKFKIYTGQQLAKYMHEEKAYTHTQDGEIIPYSLSKQIRDF